METALYELTFKDGRIFRVFTANKKQRERLFSTLREVEKTSPVVETVRNGIHDIKQFETIMNTTKDGKK